MENFPSYKQSKTTFEPAFLFSALQSKNSILLESSRQDTLNKKNLLFTSPIEIITATTLDEIPRIFDSLEKHLQLGQFVAGYFSYECGYCFENIVRDFQHQTPFPLIWLGVYDTPIEIDKIDLSSLQSTKLPAVENLIFNISLTEYSDRIIQIKECIANGETYQVNFTDRFSFDFNGKPIDLYFSLREKQHVPYSAFINTDFGTILSFSPELFFRRDGNSIITKPMKGTSKRGRTFDEDIIFSEWLQSDKKNRSENLMIVDLLRNDIGRICESGSVTGSDMYAIEQFDTILQMTSTVKGILKSETNYFDIFKSIFPCGSVTGAPKIQTMKIIHTLENHQRGVYCGAIGYFAPANKAIFNVAIRTIELHNNKAMMGVGSGVVFDSDAEKEFEECLLKANFLTKPAIDFQLLETMRWNGTFTFLIEHLNRMKSSAQYFSFPFIREKILNDISLTVINFKPEKEYRVRLLLSKDGIPTIEFSELLPTEFHTKIKIAPEGIDSSDALYFHKTTHRPLYNKYRKIAEEENIADFIFFNEYREVTEGTIYNIFIEKKGVLFTPPIHSGILSGIFRRHILATNLKSSEKAITVHDLRSADALFLCNSVRGWFEVSLSE